MENALGIALTQEVALHRILTPSRMEALKAYVKTLLAYLPTRPSVKAFLEAFSAELKSLGASASYKQYQV